MEAAETFPNAMPISAVVLDKALAAEQPVPENNAALAAAADNPTEPYTRAHPARLRNHPPSRRRR